MDKKTTYDLKYARERLKRVPLDLTLDDYAVVQMAAEAAGESINGYIKKSVAQRMTSDYSSQKGTAWTQEIQKHTAVNKSTIIDMFNQSMSGDTDV